AVIELRAALRACQEHNRPQPQFYGIDTCIGAIMRTYQTLCRAGLEAHALLYRGDLRQFHHDYTTTPSMVFVDGSHDYADVWSDLDVLRTFLAAGTPVLCHDYWGCPGVQRAIKEWAASGFFDCMGTFGASALLRASGRCTGRVCGLEPAHF